jgi:hypothetical protein
MLARYVEDRWCLSSPTVEESSAIDAVTLDEASEVPHLMERYALCEDNDDAYYAESCEEVNSAFAYALESFLNSYMLMSVCSSLAIGRPLLPILK